MQINRQTRTSEILKDRPHAAVHPNAAIFKFAQAFDHILLP